MKSIHQKSLNWQCYFEVNLNGSAAPDGECFKTPLKAFLQNPHSHKNVMYEKIQIYAVQV